MRYFLIFLVLVSLIPIAIADDNQIVDNTLFNLDNNAYVNVSAIQNFTTITVYDSSSSPTSTLEINVNGTTVGFRPSVNISLCSDSCGVNFTTPTTSFTTAPSISFTLNDTIPNPPYTFQLATDSGFITTFFSGTLGVPGTTAPVSLSYNTTYYFRAHNATGTYNRVWRFITPSAAATVPGYLNVTVVDELNYTVVRNYTASVYADGFYLSNSTTTGVLNFTSSEINSGTFELVITNMTGYAERAIIVSSPGSYIVYVPTTSRTIDFVSFYLLDYTGRFPFTSSNLTITKGVNTTHSQFFDSDAKVAANLIRGEKYTITVFNPTTDSMQQWGNYMSTGTGGVQVVIMDLGVNQSALQPYTQRINASNASIDISWHDRANVLNWVNMTVYKDNTSTPVYNLNTSIGTGTASYIITDLNATYITQVNASTTQGFKVDTSIFSAISQAVGSIKSWVFGSFTMPLWVKNAFAIIIMFMLAGSFGAMHRGEGAVITGIMGVFFWWYGMLSLQGAAGALFGGFVLYAVLYHLETKRRQGGYY